MIMHLTTTATKFVTDMASQRQLTDMLDSDFHALEVRPLFLPVLSLVLIVELIMSTMLLQLNVARVPYFSVIL